jgi:uncharacterized membrane protein
MTQSASARHDTDKTAASVTEDLRRSARGRSVASGRRIARAAAFLSAVSMIILGVWAVLQPRSFSDFINYAPYNRHLVHDAGAFQIGIGVTLLLALIWSDALLVTLTGFAVASGLHTISHYADRHLGGHDSDVPVLGLFTFIALIGILSSIHRRTT